MEGFVRRSTVKLLVLLVSLIGTTLTFNNCTKSGFKSLGSGSPSVGDSSTPSPPGGDADIVDGQEYTVTGGPFGTKDRSAPVVWDNGSHNDPITARWTEHTPDLMTGAYAVQNMDYRQVPFLRPVGTNAELVLGPHARTKRILGGGGGDPNAGYYFYNSSVSVSYPVTPAGKNYTFHFRFWH